jgi:hypothetical protein
MGQLLGTISLLLLGLPGFLLSLKILGKDRKAESLGLSFLIGSVVYTLMVFVVNFIVGIRLDLYIAWFIYLLVTLPLLFPFHQKLFGKISWKSWTNLQKLLVGILCWLFISVFITSFTFTVTDWDAVTLFDYRARIILNTGFIRDTLSRETVTAYPLLTSLLHYWVYLNGLRTPMPVYPLFFAGFILGSYGILNRLLKNRTVILLIVLLLAATPKLFDQSLIAYTNLPYTIYLLLGTGYIFLWSGSHKKADLIMGLILSLGSFWVRSFPFALVNIGLVILYSSISGKLKKTLVFLSLLIGILFLLKLGFTNVLGVLNYLKWSVWDYYQPYSLVFILLSIIVFSRNNKSYFWFLAILGYTLMLILGTLFMVNGQSSWYQVSDAVERMTMFLNPAVIWFGVELIR